MADENARGLELLKEAKRIMQERGKEAVVAWYAELPSEDKDAIVLTGTYIADVCSEVATAVLEEITEATQRISEIFERLVQIEVFETEALWQRNEPRG